MKKMLLIGFVSLLLASCVSDSDTIANDFRTEYVPIATVNMPEEFQLGQVYSIEYTYYRPTTCHTFLNLYYEVGDQGLRTIAITNRVYTGGDATCESLIDEVITRTFNYSVDTAETHHFRFWQGKDDSGNDVYLEFEVPVN